MSRRPKRRPAEGDAGAAGRRATGKPAPGGEGLGTPAQVGLLALAFGVGVGAAELAGAANLGVAFGVGQLTFVAALLWLLLRA